MQTFPVLGLPTKVLDVGQSLELIQSVIEHRRAEPRDPRAAVALDAAQRGEWLGFTDDQALAQAIDVSSRLPGLISDRVMLRVELSEVTTPS